MMLDRATGPHEPEALAPKNAASRHRPPRPLAVGEAVQEGRDRLRRQDIAEAAADASVLLAHVLGGDRAFLWAHPERLLTPAEQRRFHVLLSRRGAGEPTAYLTGIREFWSLPFCVDRRVLIPRPETEIVVETVLEAWTRSDPRIVDVGTGSGCIGIALAHERPRARVLGIDVCTAALCVARQNARQLVAEERFQLVAGRSLEPVRAGGADVVVSNPPYVAESVFTELPREIREHEPRGALASGGDGLDVTREVVAGASKALVAGGLLVLEIDPPRAEEVVALLQPPRWHRLAVKRDLAGRPRAVRALRAADPPG